MGHKSTYLAVFGISILIVLALAHLIVQAHTKKDMFTPSLCTTDTQTCKCADPQTYSSNILKTIATTFPCDIRYPPFNKALLERFIQSFLTFYSGSPTSEQIADDVNTIVIALYSSESGFDKEGYDKGYCLDWIPSNVGDTFSAANNIVDDNLTFINFVFAALVGVWWKMGYVFPANIPETDQSDPGENRIAACMENIPSSSNVYFDGKYYNSDSNYYKWDFIGVPIGDQWKNLVKGNAINPDLNTVYINTKRLWSRFFARSDVPDLSFVTNSEMTVFPFMRCLKNHCSANENPLICG